MSFILKSNLSHKNTHQKMFLTGLPTYLGSTAISMLLFPNLFSIHWIWFFILWLVFDLIFDKAYQHIYEVAYQKENVKKGQVTKWFHYKLFALQLIIMAGLFTIASPYF